MDMNYYLDQIDILEQQMQLDLWEQQQQQHQYHKLPTPPLVPTEIEILPHHSNANHDSNRRSSFPWNNTSLSPSVECHDGCVTFRPYRANHSREHLLYGMSFTTEALTNAEDVEDCYLDKDAHNNHINGDDDDDDEYDDEDDKDDDDYEEMMTQYCGFSREEEKEFEYVPRHYNIPLKDGCADKEVHFVGWYNDPKMMSTKTEMTQPSSSLSSPPLMQQQQQQQDPPVEVENRLVVISKQGRRHQTALEPEEYVYPRDFISLSNTKPSAPDPQQSKPSYSSSSSANNARMSGRRCSRSSSNISNQLTALPLSPINEQPKCGVVTATAVTNQTNSSSSSHERYNGYQHCFVTVLTEHRFLMLYTFLSRYSHHSKIVVLFSTTESLMYYTALLHRLKFHVLAVHDDMTREQVTKTLHEFSRVSEAEDEDDSTLILCKLDFQGKDKIVIPQTTNWIVQFEPCTNPSEYIYQVGRISHDPDAMASRRRRRRASHNSSQSSNNRRGSGSCGVAPPRALLFLTPNEYGFHRYFKAAQVKTYEYEIPQISNVQNRLIKLLRCEDNKQLRQLSLRACRAYLFSYARHEFGDIYDLKELDVEKVALSFGFDTLPSEELLEGMQVGGGDGDGDCELGVLFDKTFRTTSTSTGFRWKPAKQSNGTSWMTREKTWRYSDRHAEKMKVTASQKVASIKPEFVVTR